MDTAHPLHMARLHAQAGRFAQMRQACQCALDGPHLDMRLLLDIASLLWGYGFLSDARICYEQAQRHAPNDLHASIHYAGLACDMGYPGQASRLYAALLERLPHHPMVRRNLLTSLEYDPDASDAQRLDQARAWGQWAIARAGGPRPRPALEPLHNRPLRLGYVGADFCQHTVGLFVKNVLQAHDRTHVHVFVYSAGQVHDWVSRDIGAVCHFREVAALSDVALAEQIRADAIDVLIDLSGHTAGSRLTAFAYRPAPVMVSWLGYFATTGLPCMDAVLLDPWHATPQTPTQFVEPIIELASGRLPYQPVPWMPAHSAALPVHSNGFITFGCFNNTAKLNEGVFTLWAQILHAVPCSRLVLKWRTFNDPALRHRVTQAFSERAIASERIELRGPSFHADLLKEYADIDIALDPFPFTGGLTSCEALWMGVPVVTWPQGRVVSRQTFAFLHQIGMPQLAATDGPDYVRIATELAHDRAQLVYLRQNLRQRMQTSSLCDVTGFTRQLEHVLIDLYGRTGVG